MEYQIAKINTQERLEAWMDRYYEKTSHPKQMRLAKAFVESNLREQNEFGGIWTRFGKLFLGTAQAGAEQ